MTGVDRGRAAVSAAEDMAFGGTGVDVALDRAGADLALATITGGPWWASCGPPVTLAPPRRGTRSSSARARHDQVRITFAEGQLTLATVAHELAHALAGVDHGHDGVFRAAYVDVIAVLTGPDSADGLADAFRAMGVDPGARTWPAPYWARGDGFVVTSAGSASIAGGTSPSTLTATPIRGSR
jgi:hypothetical protein